MDKFTLRPAREADFSAIRTLVRSTKINPTGLKWQQFIIAESPGEKMIACGQVKTHLDGSTEIASIAVQPENRGQGMARVIIEKLMLNASRPLYLMCRFELGKLYEKFGFYAVQAEDMPPYFRRISRLASLVDLLAREGTTLLVMRCDER
ncbi:MAG: GNAT family N-acetyltransferase [Anaerolineae bacterium]|nr:GNAT family N-acetyltransferase [Anaerolineae bacterium]MBT4309235.1 GNAT family N-acetyltransferase [Anaerolineae bacterium]MBT4458534.1 GNAT family N-acetyltransferase [Anaerolineae bacterium]MBT4842710.1 GNAT family N-acetyltransferase [Anaerolineae bacterium]MBT6062047.1 GNAT family N-acetyltransferase [Anaerolineae bacterium]